MHVVVRYEQLLNYLTLNVTEFLQITRRDKSWEYSYAVADSAILDFIISSPIVFLSSFNNEQWKKFTLLVEKLGGRVLQSVVRKC